MSDATLPYDPHMETLGIPPTISRLRWSDQRNEIAAALAEAQAEIKNASRDSDNPYFGSRYADLAAVWDAIRGPFTKQGLAVLQPVSSAGALAADGTTRITVTTVVLHKSGQWVEWDLSLTVLPMPRKRNAEDGEQDGGAPRKVTPQAVGSAITYARRYGLLGVGLAPEGEDDDAESAEGRGEGRPASKPVCPECGKATIIKGREEYGGGWVCYKKMGGCGAKFAVDPAERQPAPHTPSLEGSEDELRLRASEFFQQICRYCDRAKPKDFKERLTAHLKYYLVTDDLSTVDPQSIISKLGNVRDKEAAQKGAGKTWVEETAAKHAAATPGPQPVADKKPVRGKTGPAPAGNGGPTLGTLYGLVSVKAGRGDGATLLNSYIVTQLGIDPTELLRLEPQQASYERCFTTLAALNDMDTSQIRNILIPKRDDTPSNPLVTDEDVPF